jgi:hypothetical protein
LIARIVLFFNAIIIFAFLNNGYTFSQDYMAGYVACIISDLTPEEEIDLGLS